MTEPVIRAQYRCNLGLSSPKSCSKGFCGARDFSGNVRASSELALPRRSGWANRAGVADGGGVSPLRVADYPFAISAFEKDGRDHPSLLNLGVQLYALLEEGDQLRLI